MIYKTKGGK